MPAKRPTVIIIQSPYYSDVTDMLRDSVIAELDHAGYEHYGITPDWRTLEQYAGDAADPAMWEMED